MKHIQKVFFVPKGCDTVIFCETSRRKLNVGESTRIFCICDVQLLLPDASNIVLVDTVVVGLQGFEKMAQNLVRIFGKQKFKIVLTLNCTR